MRYAGVIVDLNAEELDRVYTYSVPNGMVLAPGQRVVVPFGSRQVEGYVVRLEEQCELEPQRVKPVIRPLEAYPLLLPELLELAQWMRETYFCTLASALRQMIPAQLRRERVRVKKLRMAQLNCDEDQAQIAIQGKKSRAPRQAEVLRQLLEGARPSAGLNGSALTALKKQGLVKIYEVEQLRSPFRAPIIQCQQDPELTSAQADAVREVEEGGKRGVGRFLLLGVTGSGKTEVYIRLIRGVLQRGKGAIVLVPEISLTPQIVDLFRSRFGERAAVLHSRLSPGERYDEWRRIRRGDARVVVGARSAVFAPLEELGLIVVDEEHETSYKSDRRPRYDAREVAWERCKRAGAVLVLGSATPCIESFMRTDARVRPENRYQLLELNQRVNGRPLPTVEIVDMGKEISRGNNSMLSGALQQALLECLAEGKQSILFINRRGYSTFVSCRKCGYVERCQACDVSMIYHRSDDMLRCHYCGAMRRPPKRCPECGSVHIRYFGIGTQKVQEAVQALLPGARLARMDLDTTGGKDGHEKILSAFGRREADVLIGTQMIAKGLDFPDVTLVGVVAADMSLNIPDYRAAERTFQLLTQVAGRAGRAQDPGRVIIQTCEPDHYAIQLAAKQDYRAFYRKENTLRRRALYPPYTRLARLLVTGKDEEAVIQKAQSLEKELGDYLNEESELKSYVVHMRALEAPLGMIRGEYRWQVFVKLYRKPEAQQILAKMDEFSREQKDVRIDLEIDPSNML